METPKNTTDTNRKGLVHKVKMAAAILLGALAINAATSQNANAQDLDFSNITSKEEIAKLDKQNEQKRNENAKKRERNAKTLDRIDQKRAKIEELEKRKGNKQSSKTISRAKAQQLSGDGK